MNTGIVRSLIGQRCWYVSAGGATWPSFVLVCGDMIPRELPLSNPAHPETFKNNRGSIELLVWCSWRIQTDSKVLASSDEAESGAKALGALAGTPLIEARCSAPWDLALAFSSGLAIQVFADNHGLEPTASQNWELWVPGRYVRAGLGEAWGRTARLVLRFPAMSEILVQANKENIMVANKHDAVRKWRLYIVIIAAGCSASDSLYNTREEAKRNEVSSPEISCDVVPVNDKSFLITYEIRNDSPRVVHIIQNNQLPYQLVRDTNTLVILHGFHAYDPNILPAIIQLPVTRPLGTGEVLKGKIAWLMPAMRDYYRGHGTPANLLHGTIKVRCEAGWWSGPISEADRLRLPLSQVLALQHVVGYGPLEVTLP